MNNMVSLTRPATRNLFLKEMMGSIDISVPWISVENVDLCGEA